MGIVHQVQHQLLLVHIGVDVPDDGQVHLDIPGRQEQQALFTVVAAAIVVQGKHTGAVVKSLLPLQRCHVHVLLFHDLNDGTGHQGRIALFKFRRLFFGQALVGNGIDKHQLIWLNDPLFSQRQERL